MMKKVYLNFLIIFCFFAFGCNTENDKISGTYVLDTLSDSICFTRNQKLILNSNGTYDFYDNGKSTSGKWEVPEGADFLSIDFYKNNSKEKYQATFCEGDNIVFLEPNKFLNNIKVFNLCFKKDTTARE